MSRKLFLSIFSLFCMAPTGLYSMQIKDLMQEDATVEQMEGDVKRYTEKQSFIDTLMEYISDDRLSVDTIKLFMEGNNICAEDLTSEQLTLLGFIAGNVTGNRGCQLVSYLLSKDADINRRSGVDQKLPIEFALKASNMKVACCLMKHGAYINEKILSIKNDDDFTILHYIVDNKYDDLELIKHVIARGANIRAPYPDGTSILMQAALTTCSHEDDGELLNLLLECNLNPNEKNERGLTLLHVLADAEWDVAFEELLDIELADGSGPLRVIDILLEHGVSIDQRSSDRETPLMYAVKHGRFDVAYALILRGACVQWQNDEIGSKIKTLVERSFEAVDALRILTAAHNEDLSLVDETRYDVLFTLNWILNNTDEIRKDYAALGSSLQRRGIIKNLAKNNSILKCISGRESGVRIKRKKHPYMPVKEQKKREKKRRRFSDEQS